MKGRDYDNSFFEEVTGAAVDGLWAKYCESLDKGDDDAEDEADAGRPLEKWPMPQLLIRVDDLDHEGVDVFFAAVKPKDALREAVMASFNWLYTLESVPTKVKQIMLILRPMTGVAHTMGTATHKEIHFLSTTSSKPRLVPATKLWVCWCMKLCIVSVYWPWNLSWRTRRRDG
ncbi:hypothetical protein BDZ97DRAFT_221480 [Flammula alnicola]|nr:hypothetical protein BDZ97DRAFT_221480 [Flammula alnicola]